MSARNGKWGITLSTCFPKKIRIFDPTLRDEEQTSGVSLTAENKLRIAKRLDELGVDVIEAGFASEDKMEAVKHIVKEGLRAEISSCSRGAKGDIDAVVEMNVLMADYSKSGDSWAKNFLKEGWATIRGTLVSWGYRREGSLPRIETASLSFRPKRFVKENSVFLPLSPSIKLMIVGCLAKKRYQSND